MANTQQLFCYQGKWMPLTRYQKARYGKELNGSTPIKDTQDDLSEDNTKLDKDIKEKSLEAVRALYEAKFNKSVPNNMKNNIEWITNKIN